MLAHNRLMARKAQRRGPDRYGQVDIRVTNRDRPNIVGGVINLFLGLVLIVVIAAVLLGCLGAVIVNLGTTGGLPQPVVDISVNLYNSVSHI